MYSAKRDSAQGILTVMHAEKLPPPFSVTKLQDDMCNKMAMFGTKSGFSKTHCGHSIYEKLRNHDELILDDNNNDEVSKYSVKGVKRLIKRSETLIDFHAMYPRDMEFLYKGNQQDPYFPREWTDTFRKTFKKANKNVPESEIMKMKEEWSGRKSKLNKSTKNREWFKKPKSSVTRHMGESVIRKSKRDETDEEVEDTDQEEEREDEEVELSDDDVPIASARAYPSDLPRRKDTPVNSPRMKTTAAKTPTSARALSIVRTKKQATRVDEPEEAYSPPASNLTPVNVDFTKQNLQAKSEVYAYYIPQPKKIMGFAIIPHTEKPSVDEADKLASMVSFNGYFESKIGYASKSINPVSLGTGLDQFKHAIDYLDYTTDGNLPAQFHRFEVSKASLQARLKMCTSEVLKNDTQFDEGRWVKLVTDFFDHETIAEVYKEKVTQNEKQQKIQDIMRKWDKYTTIADKEQREISYKTLLPQNMENGIYKTLLKEEFDKQVRELTSESEMIDFQNLFSFYQKREVFTRSDFNDIQDRFDNRVKLIRHLVSDNSALIKMISNGTNIPELFTDFPMLYQLELEGVYKRTVNTRDYILNEIANEKYATELMNSNKLTERVSLSHDEHVECESFLAGETIARWEAVNLTQFPANFGLNETIAQICGHMYKTTEKLIDKISWPLLLHVVEFGDQEADGIQTFSRGQGDDDAQKAYFLDAVCRMITRRSSKVTSEPQFREFNYINGLQKSSEQTEAERAEERRRDETERHANLQISALENPDGEISDQDPMESAVPDNGTTRLRAHPPSRRGGKGPRGSTGQIQTPAPETSSANRGSRGRGNGTRGTGRPRFIVNRRPDQVMRDSAEVLASLSNQGQPAVQIQGQVLLSGADPARLQQLSKAVQDFTTEVQAEAKRQAEAKGQVEGNRQQTVSPHDSDEENERSEPEEPEEAEEVEKAGEAEEAEESEHSEDGDSSENESSDGQDGSPKGSTRNAYEFGKDQESDDENNDDENPDDTMHQDGSGEAQTATGIKLPNDFEKGTWTEIEMPPPQDKNIPDKQDGTVEAQSTAGPGEQSKEIVPDTMDVVEQSADGGQAGDQVTEGGQAGEQSAEIVPDTMDSQEQSADGGQAGDQVVEGGQGTTSAEEQTGLDTGEQTGEVVPETQMEPEPAPVTNLGKRPLPETGSTEGQPNVTPTALKLKGGATLGTDLSVTAVLELEQQVKRVMGADPAQELNVSSLRSRPDTELLRILFLAVLGNFTSGAGSNWQQPCSLVVDTRTGLVGLEETPALASLAQKVVLMLLVAVQFKQWVEEVRANRKKGGERRV